MAILEIKELSKKYRGNTNFAVNEASLVINQGEIIALLGESGSGKTTLLRLIAGFEKAQSGNLLIKEKSILNLPPEKRNIGMVFQDYALFPHMTVTQNIGYGINGTKTEKQAIISEVLQLVDMLGFKNRYPHQLSGGQQQRIALARALATKPDVLLLDEPFSNLDEALKEQVRNDLKSILKTSGITAIFVTHDTRDALAVADRIAILKEGMLQQFDSPKTLYETPQNEYVAQYFGKVNWLASTINQSQAKTAIGQFKLDNKNIKDGNYLMGVRPEHFHLESQKASNLTAIVTSSKFLGQYQEAKIKIGETILIAYFNIKLNLDNNIPIHLKIDTSKLIFIKSH